MNPTIAQQQNINRANAETRGDLALSFLLSVVVLACLLPSWWRKQSRKQCVDMRLRAEANRHAAAQRAGRTRGAA